MYILFGSTLDSLESSIQCRSEDHSIMFWRGKSRDWSDTWQFGDAWTMRILVFHHYSGILYLPNNNKNHSKKGQRLIREMDRNDSLSVVAGWLFTSSKTETCFELDGHDLHPIHCQTWRWKRNNTRQTDPAEGESIGAMNEDCRALLCGMDSLELFDVFAFYLSHSTIKYEEFWISSSKKTWLFILLVVCASIDCPLNGKRQHNVADIAFWRTLRLPTPDAPTPGAPSCRNCGGTRKKTSWSTRREWMGLDAFVIGVRWCPKWTSSTEKTYASLCEKYTINRIWQNREW